MENDTNIFELISKLGDLHGAGKVEIDLYYLGNRKDNSNRSKLFYFSKIASLKLIDRISHYDHLSKSADNIFFELSSILIKYKNHTFEFDFSDGYNGVTEIVYFDSLLLAKNNSYGDNEEEMLDESIYKYVPLSISRTTISYDESSANELINLLAIEGIRTWNEL